MMMMNNLHAMHQFARLIRLSSHRRRRAIIRLAARALRDDSGGEVLEYALVAGLIVVGAVGAITCVGAKVSARWTSIGSNL